MFYPKKSLSFYALLWLGASFAMFTPPQVPQLRMQKLISPRGFAPKTVEELAQAKTEADTKKMKALRSKKCYDVMIIMDDIKGEKIDSSNPALANELIEALAQKSFPIIVSTNIVYNVCVDKPEIELHDDAWYCYDHPEADIMLFLPKTYLLNFSNNPIDANTDASIKLAGFNTDHLKKIDLVSYPNLLSYLRDKKIRESTMPITDAIESLFMMPIQPNAPTWNIYLIGHGKTNQSIAGLHKKDFFALLRCFEKINTSLLHYSSCFSGGANLMEVKEQLAQLNAPFIVSAQGINEDLTYSISTIKSDQTEGYPEFFKRADAFFGDPYAFVQTNKEQDPIAFVLSPIINKLTLDYAQPFVYIPAVGVFNALVVDKQVKVITKAITRAHTFENKAIDCTKPDIKTIIVYPNYISVPLKIAPHIAIVSPTQAQVHNIDLHFFEEIISGDTLSSIIFNCVSFNLKYRPTTFAIKKLECFNFTNSELELSNSDRITLENVIIYCGDIRNDGRNRIFNVFACFDCNKKSYKVELLRNKILEENTADELFKRFETLTCTPINETAKYPNPIDNLPYALLEYPPLAELLTVKGKKTYISCAEIVNAIQEFNKPDFGNEPDSLKKVILKKQLDLATQEGNDLPEKLYQAKKRISKQENNFLTAYITYLERMKEKIGWLESEVRAIPLLDQSKIKALNDLTVMIDEELNRTLIAQQSEKEQQSWAGSFANKIHGFYNMFADYTQPIINHLQEITGAMYDESKKISKPR